MTNFEQTKGTLQVVIDAHMPDSDSILKQLQVFDAGLTLKESNWIDSKNWNHELIPGIYMVRLNLPSGSQLEQVAQIQKGEVTKLDFEIGQFSPRESQEWMYLTKGNAGNNPINYIWNGASERSIKIPTAVSVRRWQLDDFIWKATDDTINTNKFINEIGETFTFHVPQAMQLLELEILGKPSCFVCLPPADLVKCMIKLAEGPQNVVPELDISISTSNDKAQALLSLITSGDMAKAKTLTSVEDAANLLYSKMGDPASAAIGGYFLLKTGELARMHDWANNLANRFLWMPDGSIIHAWQMIQEGNLETTVIATIKDRLLEAVNRGIPIYTEGMRLLYDGLNMLANEFKKEDQEVELALERIKHYMYFVDMSQETTTYTGTYPDKPGADKKDDFAMIRPILKIE